MKSLDGDKVIVDFNNLSDWGLIEIINNQLTPLGLKLLVDETGVSFGCEVSPTLYFENTPIDKHKYEKFIINRYHILTTILETSSKQK